MSKRKGAAEPDPAASKVIRDTIGGRGLAANAVAEESGLPPSVVSRFVAGDRGVSLESADRMIRALGLRLVEGRGGLGKR
jgi:plasmid maintenance system antidote protein VapI